MASDDRPDDRRRFTLRRFFSPDDAADETAADDAAEETVEQAGPAEAFGTGGIDDDALDAVVEGAGPSAIVWGSEEVPPPVPGAIRPAPEAGPMDRPDGDGEARASDDDPFGAERASVDEFVDVAPPTAAADDTPQVLPVGDLSGADDADEAEDPDLTPADDFTLAFESSVLEPEDQTADETADAAGPGVLGSVLGALADAIEPDDLDDPKEEPAADAVDPFAFDAEASEEPVAVGPEPEGQAEDEPGADAPLADASDQPSAAVEPAAPAPDEPPTDDAADDEEETLWAAAPSPNFLDEDAVTTDPDPAALTPEAAEAADVPDDEASATDLPALEPVGAAEPEDAAETSASGPDPETADATDSVVADAAETAAPPDADPSEETTEAIEAASDDAVETPPADAVEAEASDPAPAADEPVATDAVAPNLAAETDDLEAAGPDLDEDPSFEDDLSEAEPVAAAPETPDAAPSETPDAVAEAADERVEPTADAETPDVRAEAADEPTAETPVDGPQPDDAPDADEPEAADPPLGAADPTPDAPSEPTGGDGVDEAAFVATSGLLPLSETISPDPDPSSMETVEIDADTATADPTAAVDEAFEGQTDPAKAGTTGTDGIEGDLEVTPLGPDDFAPGELRGVLRTMMLSRKLDEKMLTLLKQGKGFFHIGSAGHEASQIAVASQFEGGSDWFCCYYRDLATTLTVGLEAADVLRAHYGKAADPFGGGRQMPEHFGHRGLNIMSTSSSVGAQYVPAVGFALACKREDEAGARRAVYTSGGEGSTSQGAFHEALNWAAREALPVLFHIQDNKYAISVPVEEQTAGGSIWHLLGGYAGLRRLRYDGTDFFQSAAAARAAMAHIRAGHGPVALHADLVRLLPHSSSDDHKKYREAASLEADAARDPIPRLAGQLVEAGVMTGDEVEALRAEVAAEIDRLAKEIEKEADPDPATATRHVYYEGPDDREYEVEGEAGDLIVMVDAINHALDEEMSRDDRVLVYGEDVGGGKGGVFTATRGLTAKHGRDRCFNSPLAEHSVLGSAVGLACAGYKPVVEIQFADYIWPGMQPLRNQIASMRYRSDGAWACPMVIRVPAGGYIHGGLCHSQNIEAIFGHFPGLHVVMPSNAADAKGLLKSAIRGQDPVLFLEHKALYRQGPARRPEPHGEYLVPLGKAAVTREGTDLTIVTWGAIVYKALAAAKALEKEGVSVEVVDVRSFLPFDSETVLASVKKTGRVLIAYEDHEFMGFGAEIAAQVADGAFGHLDAPVKRVAGAFSSIPYADPLEKAVLPQDADVLDAAREVLAY